MNRSLFCSQSLYIQTALNRLKTKCKSLVIDDLFMNRSAFLASILICGGLGLFEDHQVYAKPKAEVMILIDSSSSMQYRLDTNTFPQHCSVAQRDGLVIGENGQNENPDPNENPDFNENKEQDFGEKNDQENHLGQPVFHYTRMQWIKEILAGQVVGNKGCLAHSPEERGRPYLANNSAQSGHITGIDGQFPHFRLMCPSENNPDPHVPCGHDHGRGRTDSDPDNSDQIQAVGIQNNGIIDQTNHEVHFGLMTSDGNPSVKKLNEGEGPVR